MAIRTKRSDSKRARTGPASRRRNSRTRQQARERLLKATDQAARSGLAPKDVDLLSETIESALYSLRDADAAGASDDVSPITGEPLPSRAQVARAQHKNLLRSFSERRDLLADALSAGEVAVMLGVGRQTPHDRVRASTLLAIKDNGRLLFPEWQFDPAGPDGVVEGLPEVLQELRAPMSPLARIKWFLIPKPLLSGRTPLQALRDGDIEATVLEARASGAS